MGVAIKAAAHKLARRGVHAALTKGMLYEDRMQAVEEERYRVGGLKHLVKRATALAKP